MSKLAIQIQFQIDLYAPPPPLEPPLYASESSVLDLRTAAAVEESKFPMLVKACDFRKNLVLVVDVVVVVATGCWNSGYWCLLLVPWVASESRKRKNQMKVGQYSVVEIDIIYYILCGLKKFLT